MPFPVHPGFHPSVVVIAMGPTWGVNLSGRDAHGAQGRHQQCGFFAATAPRGLDGGHGSTGAAVGAFVVDMLMAPMVHLKHGVIKRHVLNSCLQLFIIGSPESVKVLIVHPWRQHKMLEFSFGDAGAPGHFSLGSKSKTDTFAVIFPGIVHVVA